MCRELVYMRKKKHDCVGSVTIGDDECRLWRQLIDVKAFAQFPPADGETRRFARSHFRRNNKRTIERHNAKAAPNAC